MLKGGHLCCVEQLFCGRFASIALALGTTRLLDRSFVCRLVSTDSPFLLLIDFLVSTFQNGFSSVERISFHLSQFFP